MNSLNLLPELQTYDTVILANGEIPSHVIPLEFLKRAKRIVCCDGAIHTLLSMNYEPVAIVGDCDSIGEDLFNRFKEKIYQDQDTEYNDLNKAIRFCMQNGWTSVAILGATGLRDDHFLANIGIFTMYAEQVHLVMVTNFGIFTPIWETASFRCYPAEQVSFFTFAPETRITLHNLRYPLTKASFRYFWEGSLNEALQEEFTVEIENGIVLVYRVF